MKGICFKEPLFLATIEGRKTQTRRVMKPQPSMYRQTVGKLLGMFNINPSALRGEMKPRYKVGEVVYLKEPYASSYNEETDKWEPIYKYGGPHYFDIDGGSVKWKSKLWMPETKARYFIRITDVRAERLQDISDEDCCREGIVLRPECEQSAIVFGLFLEGGHVSNLGSTPREAYGALIDAINGKGTWDSNPFVWVYEYESYQMDVK